MLFSAALTLAAASFAAARPVARDTAAMDPIMAGQVIAAALTQTNTTQTARAAYYYQNGRAGACGLFSEDTDKVVGLPLEYYSDLEDASPYCGSYMVVTNLYNNVSTIVRVADASTDNSTLSMSIASWRAVNLDGNVNHNYTVEWRWANANETASAKAAAANAPAADSTVVANSPSAATTKANAPAAATTSAQKQSQAAQQQQETTSAAAQKQTTTQKPYTTTTTQKPYTTTTTSKPAATSAKSSSSKSSGSYSGQATYYTQNGVTGACGSVSSDSDYIVAIDSAMYSGGSNCGRMVSITNQNNGKSVSAKVMDECPTCASSGSLDLSVAAFGAIASQSDGVAPISWSFQ